MKVLDWVKRNKLAALLLVILLYILGKQFASNFFGVSLKRGYTTLPSADSQIGIAPDSYSGMKAPKRGGIIPPPSYDYAPAPEVTDRLVIEQSYLSLLVKNVRESADKIIKHAQTSGGYMVNSSFESPNESPTSTVIVRIPSKDLDSTLDFFRKLSIRVVSENLTGQDVTDQFVDNEARLATLNQTKAKFQEIFDRAAEISDIVNIQQQLINIQSQIDAVKGQQQYLEKSAQMAKVTIYLATDELSLPYAPSDSWRPSVIFKQAVRSLVLHLRGIASAVIWIVVFSVFWIPVLLVFYYIRKHRKVKLQ